MLFVFDTFMEPFFFVGGRVRPILSRGINGQRRFECFVKWADTGASSALQKEAIAGLQWKFRSARLRLVLVCSSVLMMSLGLLVLLSPVTASQFQVSFVPALALSSLLVFGQSRAIGWVSEEFIERLYLFCGVARRMHKVGRPLRDRRAVQSNVNSEGDRYIICTLGDSMFLSALQQCKQDTAGFVVFLRLLFEVRMVSSSTHGVGHELIRDSPVSTDECG